MIRAIVGEKRFDRRAIGKLDGILGVANDLFKTSEEKHFNARCL